MKRLELKFHVTHFRELFIDFSAYNGASSPRYQCQAEFQITWLHVYYKLFCEHTHLPDYLFDY